MSNNYESTLPHLPYDIVEQVRGWNLDAYLIALEGWRRGLKLKFYSNEHPHSDNILHWYTDTPGRLFSLSDGEQEHVFYRSRGDLVCSKAIKEASDKWITKKKLLSKNVPVPKGKAFNLKETSEIINYAWEITYPIVIKPFDGSFGRNVYTDIKTDKELKNILSKMYLELGNEKIIVEKHIAGKEYRLYVVGNEVVAAINRIPANVVGDGEKTIKELILDKNKDRLKNPRLYSCLIKIDEKLISELKNKEKNLDYIPKVNETVYLNDKSNISLGGDSIAVLEELPDNVKQIAVDSVKAFENLSHAGVDLIITSDLNGKKTGKVIELNPTAQLGSLIFPMIGEGRDVPSKIVDYYFTDSKRYTDTLYFKLSEVITPLTDLVCDCVELPTLAREPYVQKKYILEFKELGVEKQVSDFLTKLAHQYRAFGNFSKVSKKLYEINLEVKSSLSEKMLEDIKRFFEELEITVEKSTERSHLLAKQEFNADRNKYIKKIKKYDKEIKEIEDVNRQMNKQQKKMLSSTSWKITKPIRNVGRIIKRINRK